MCFSDGPGIRRPGVCEAYSCLYVFSNTFAIGFCNRFFHASRYGFCLIGDMADTFAMLFDRAFVLFNVSLIAFAIHFDIVFASFGTWFGLGLAKGFG